MKAYSISSPEKLRDIADSIQWNEDYRRAMSFANRWDRDRAAYKVTLELGKGATLRVEDGEAKTPLATIYLAAARDFVKGLVEA